MTIPKQPEERKSVIASWPDATKEFSMEEHKQRRKEIEDTLGRLEADQKNSLYMMGAFWAWLATNRMNLTDPLSYVAVVLPALIMAFFLLRFFILISIIFRVAEYIEKLEKRFELPDGCGWETHLAEQRKSRKVEVFLRYGGIGFWISLIVVNVAIAVVYVVFKA